MVNLVLASGSLIFIAFLAAVEGFTIWTGHPTISARLQRFASKNVQIACLVALVVGWLVAHFTGYSG